MPVKAFLNSRFATTHENQIFDELLKRLKERWDSSDEQIVLLGNFFYNNRDIDAMLIKRDAIIVVDFKDYGGQLRFSENSIWTIGEVTVKGGAFINPFMQVRSSKSLVSNFFKENLENIFLTATKKIFFNDVFGLILFHRQIELINPLPGEVKKWFFISDINNICQTLHQIVNPNLNISSEEIERIPNLLGLQEYKLFQSERIILERTKQENSDTNFILTTSQKSAVAKIEEFLNNPSEKIFILKGSAGTGKTYLIKEIINLISSKGFTQFRIAAPTGKAVANIKSRFTELSIKTTHSIIYKRTPESDEELEKDTEQEDEKLYKLKFHLKENSDDPNTIYIVDEATLMSDSKIQNEFLQFGTDKLLSDFFEFTQLTSNERKIIFIGDDLQMLRGNEELSAMNPEYLIKEYSLKVNSFELNEIVRQAADNPIISEAAKIRNSIAIGIYNEFDIQTDSLKIISTTAENLKREYLKCISENRLQDTIVIKYSNNQVQEANQKIRENILGKKGEIQAGDIIMFYRNYYFEEGISFQNGETAIVTKVQPIEEIYSPTGKNKKEIPLRFRKIHVDTGEGKNIEINLLENFLVSDETTLTKEETVALIILFKKNYKSKHQKYPSPKNCGSTAEYYRALNSDKYLNCALLKFAYSITGHKAQGSEWESVFIDFEWKNQAKNFKELFFRWAYTSFTRAKTKVYLINNPVITPSSKMVWNDIGAVIVENSKFVSDNSKPKNDLLNLDFIKIPIPKFLRNYFKKLITLLNENNFSVPEISKEQNFLKVTICKNNSKAIVLFYYKNEGFVTSVYPSKSNSKEFLDEIKPLIFQLKET